MIVEFITYVLMASLIAIMILGHVLLASALVQCARENFTGGRGQANASLKRADLVRRFKSLVSYYARAARARAERRAARAG